MVKNPTDLQNELALTPRWSPMYLHAKQRKMVRCKARYHVVPCGRRSGKSELKKRKMVQRAITENRWPNARYIAAAPIRPQAKEIFWDDMKGLSPKWMIKKISESELSIEYHNGAKIIVMGMDEPARAEGPPLNGVLLDEYGNMRPEAWTDHVRPMLIEREGWADFTGVPEGRNHYYNMYQYALDNPSGEWAVHHWTTEEVLPLYIGKKRAELELAALKAELDEMTYRQEILGEFISFSGAAYYPFSSKIHARELQAYDPLQDLVLCFDFNVEPGVCAIIQEKPRPGSPSETITCVIDEVFIPKNSNTPLVCQKVLAKYSTHKGDVYVYGDPAGGARGTAKVTGSDWDLITDHLRPVFGTRFKLRVDTQPPKERVRINAVNCRLLSMDKTARLLVDPVKCKFVIRDFEGVSLVKDGSGEIDKSKHRHDGLSHISDAIGYYIQKKFPVRGHIVSTQSGLV